MAAPGQGFFPGRAPIDAYGKGGFRFAEMSHRGGIFCLPSGIHAWEPGTSDSWSISDFLLLDLETAPIDFVLLGTGDTIRPLPDSLRYFFRERRIQADAMSTGAAVRTYNVMLAEDRRVAGAFLAVGG